MHVTILAKDFKGRHAATHLGPTPRIASLVPPPKKQKHSHALELWAVLLFRFHAERNSDQREDLDFFGT